MLYNIVCISEFVSKIYFYKLFSILLNNIENFIPTTNFQVAAPEDDPKQLYIAMTSDRGKTYLNVFFKGLMYEPCKY